MENEMKWYKLDNKKQILKIIKYFVSSKEEVEVRIKGAKDIFKSRFIKIDYENVSSENGGIPDLIIEKLVPEQGNILIQGVPDVFIESSINERFCRCSVKYKGTRNTYPYFGFVLSFPEIVKIQERRTEERVDVGMHELVSVQFRLRNGRNSSKKDKVYNLNVVNYAGHGLGLLITEKEFELLQMINETDKLYNMIFFAKTAMIRGNGTVKHKTKIKEGKYKGCYIMGIESDNIN